MKKFIIAIVTLFITTSMFSQEIVEVIGVKWDTKNKSTCGPYDGSYVYLSNGQYLKYVLRKNVWGEYIYSYWMLFTKNESGFKRVHFFVKPGDENLVGQKFEKEDDTFTRINQQKSNTSKNNRSRVYNIKNKQK